VPDIGIVEDFTVAALEKAFSDRVCGLFMEPIQGEGGIVPLPAEFVRAARELCDRFNALLVVDEIQSGLGRTGKWFGFEHFDIKPDVMTLAKSLAAGYPLGAMIGSARVADCLKAGDHGTTFGGGPLACRLALEVLAIIEDEKLIDRVEQIGDYLMEGIRKLAKRHPVIQEGRGKEVVGRLLQKGFITNAAHDTVLRLLPPFIIGVQDVDEFLAALNQVLNGIATK
jgi:acetylornithine aminotransferase/acetylornithine/N-succinyldiaminopimelate aminotransferase